MKLTRTAVWRTRAWPRSGGASSTSSQRSASGPPVAWIRIAFIVRRPLFQRVAEQRDGSGVGLLGGFLEVMLAARPGEGVVGLGIVVERRLGVAVQAVMHDLLLFLGHELVLDRDVQDQRRLDVAGFEIGRAHV